MLPVYFAYNDIFHTEQGIPPGRHKADVVVEDYQGNYNFAYPTFPTLDASFMIGIGYRFNLRNLFKNYSGFKLPLPKHDQINPEMAKGNIVKAKIRVQSVGVANGFENTSDVYAILNGGMSEADFKKLGNEFFNTWAQVKGPFLTWQPKVKKITTDMPDHLYWLQNVDAGTIEATVRYTVTYVNGALVETTTTFDKTVNLKAYELACIPLRPHIFRIFNNSIDPKAVLRFTVQVLYATASYASEIRTYRQFENTSMVAYGATEAPPTDTPIYLKFLNSFGVWDTVRMYGRVKQSTETEHFSVSYDRRVSLVDIEGFDKLEVNTGALDQNWLRYMKQILYARKIYHITPKGDRELILSPNNLDTFNTLSPNESANFEFRYAEQDTQFSNL